MRRLILRNYLSPGDLVVFTAAVRDLHRLCPGQYETDVRSSCPDLWRNNPHLTRLRSTDPGVEVLDCETPLVEQANLTPVHYLHAGCDFLSRKLGVQIHPTEFKGDLHLSAEERALPSPMRLVTGSDLEVPFWLVCAGGKHDVTIKWWDAARFQAVIDYFAGRLLFVQVGAAGDHHPRLERTLDLRGRTTLRQLIRWVHHADGVLCGVTALMHMAAAVERPAGIPGLRPCVVVAGGREPVQWEAYPGHRYLHTIGQLPCCAAGGCWKMRTSPLGDGSENDEPENLCVDRVGDLPRCMDTIQPRAVIDAIEGYLTGGASRELSQTAAHSARAAAVRFNDGAFDRLPLTIHSVRLALDRRGAEIPAFAPTDAGFEGRGIVICAGTAAYFTNAWVCVKMLRKWGCPLPIQFWHLGPTELDGRMAALVAPLGVECVNAFQVARANPPRLLDGWALKPFAILRSPFREVLLLDADNVPLADPAALFDAGEYRACGAVFWPDYPNTGPSPAVWRFCGMPPREEPPFETGQILVDKSKCWRALQLAMWFNENLDFFYDHVLGDKETFHLAFRKTGTPYVMPARGMEPIEQTMCQHDFDGRRLFQHRNQAKWALGKIPRRIPGFECEEECIQFLVELERAWDGRIAAAVPDGHWTKVRG